MSPHPTALLGLVLCLAQTIHAQEGESHLRPVFPEPGTVIPLGRPVTLQCRGPVGVYAFRLEREDRFEYKDNYNVFRLGPFESEARFRIDSVSEANAGLYRCIYYKTPRWSEHSDYLDLVVKGEDVTWTLPQSQLGPRACPQVPGPCPSCCPLSVATLALLLTPKPSSPPLPLHTPPLCPRTCLGPWSPGLLRTPRMAWTLSPSIRWAQSWLCLAGWGVGSQRLGGDPPTRG
uniref:Immunoglobulin domain-containing protein n=1 Tax=Macaca mulatta TaxID=9544 RepID=A0A5F8A4U1_MACMU